ncbi:MAG: hypothetical protein WBA23_23180 [Tunicatimonas sp.]|uniref:hypothetical protein n=1 Tax=Tunicatimonas sp. TaxID=1940096 RepID=UPI003C74E9D7
MSSNKITSDGRERWKQTDGYQHQVAKIKEVVTGQYALLLLSERSWPKRLILKARRTIEIRKRIAKLDSNKNLYWADGPIRIK